MAAGTEKPLLAPWMRAGLVCLVIAWPTVALFYAPWLVGDDDCDPTNSLALAEVLVAFGGAVLCAVAAGLPGPARTRTVRVFLVLIGLVLVVWAMVAFAWPNLVVENCSN